MDIEIKTGPVPTTSTTRSLIQDRSDEAMDNYLSDDFPELVAGRQRRLSVEDAWIWGEWLRRPPFETQWIRFDVGFPASASDASTGAGALNTMWTTLRRKRADVVVSDGRALYVLELKPVLSFAAVGQALGYGHLARRAIGNRAEVRQMIVFKGIDADLMELCRVYDVLLWQV